MVIGGMWKRFFQKGAPLQSTGLQLSVSPRNAGRIVAKNGSLENIPRPSDFCLFPSATANSSRSTQTAPRKSAGPFGGRKRGPVFSPNTSASSTTAFSWTRQIASPDRRLPQTIAIGITQGKEGALKGGPPVMEAGRTRVSKQPFKRREPRRQNTTTEGGEAV